MEGENPCDKATKFILRQEYLFHTFDFTSEKNEKKPKTLWMYALSGHSYAGLFRK